MNDTILCRDKEDAKSVVDSIGTRHIEEFEYFDSGEVKIILDCTIQELKNDEIIPFWNEFGDDECLYDDGK